MTTEKVTEGNEAVYYLVNMYYVRRVANNGKITEVTDNVEKNRVYTRWAIDKAMRCVAYAKQRLGVQ